VALILTRANLENIEDRQIFLDLSREYFTWMNPEIVAVSGLSIPDMVGMDIESYVQYTVGTGADLGTADGGLYFFRAADGFAIAMGGLRRLPDDAAEIVRIFTRAQCRGQGAGTQMVNALIGEAKRLGYGVIRLDTGVFMTSAQRIYKAAGFIERDPYPGAEPPERLQPHWLYMERRL